VLKNERVNVCVWRWKDAGGLFCFGWSVCVCEREGVYIYECVCVCVIVIGLW
jgi:hypothetical protein